jgi:hypothetical protein
MLASLSEQGPNVGKAGLNKRNGGTEESNEWIGRLSASILSMWSYAFLRFSVPLVQSGCRWPGDGLKVSTSNDEKADFYHEDTKARRANGEEAG